MEFVFCFCGMTIFCCILGLIFSMMGSFFDYKNKMNKAEKSFSLAKSFRECSYYFLILEAIALFFV